MRLPFRRRRSAWQVAAEFWEADLACQSANETYWATGVEGHPSGDVAADFDSRAAGLLAELAAVSGGLEAGWGLPEIAATFPESDGQASAAAVLRVFGACLPDCESLQPGRELPAVGEFAGLSW